MGRKKGSEEGREGGKEGKEGGREETYPTTEEKHLWKGPISLVPA
jgi:hypothetical protein